MTGQRWVVDGIEEGVARVEVDGELMITMPIEALPSSLREGQVLKVERTSAVVTIAIDKAATGAANDKSGGAMRDAMKQSRKKDPGGNVVL